MGGEETTVEEDGDVIVIASQSADGGSEGDREGEVDASAPSNSDCPTDFPPFDVCSASAAADETHEKLKKSLAVIAKEQQDLARKQANVGPLPRVRGPRQTSLLTKVQA